MIAGTIALLEEPVDEPLESIGTGGFTTLDVRETQEYLDGATVQRGAAASHVESQTEEIHINGTEIDVETVGTDERVYTEWVADVTDAGFVAAERTAGNVPVFPFDVFESRTKRIIEPAVIDPGSFAESQERTDNLLDVWYAGSKAENADPGEPDDVQMGYGRDASTTLAKTANIGVGFRTSWNGTVARGVLYESGYAALYNDSWGPVQFARFLREEVLPHAKIPEPEDESEQATLEGGEA